MKSKQPKPKPIRTRQDDAGAMLDIVKKLAGQVRTVQPGPLLPEQIKAIFANVDCKDHAGLLVAEIRAVRMLHAAGISTDAELTENLAFFLHRLGEEKLLRAIEAGAFVGPDMPEDVRALDEEWESRARAIVEATLRQYGEDALADLYRADYDAFHELYERARGRFFPETSAPANTGSC